MFWPFIKSDSESNTCIMKALFRDSQLPQNLKIKEKARQGIKDRSIKRDDLCRERNQRNIEQMGAFSECTT